MTQAHIFGAFRLTPQARRLERDGIDVCIGSRAFDMLVALVERPGQVLSRRDLMAAAWPGLVVEESNVRVQVANLRRAVGCGESGIRHIASIAGRGYAFVTKVERVTIDDAHHGDAFAGERQDRVLDRLSIFDTSFSLAEAIAVAAFGPVGARDVAEAVAGFVSKAFLLATAGDGSPAYRLEPGIAAPARARLTAHRDYAQVAERLALIEHDKRPSAAYSGTACPVSRSTCS
ncbi:transcriptional regulator [Bacillus sp. NP157]|nr:transcriptional regulator [Bacillus sp. NP157]